MDIVAACDIDSPQLRLASEALSAVPYQDYDAFLAHDMDGVILANYFDEHAPLALKALNAGKHVMSEPESVDAAHQGRGIAAKQRCRAYLWRPPPIYRTSS